MSDDTTTKAWARTEEAFDHSATVAAEESGEDLATAIKGDAAEVIALLKRSDDDVIDGLNKFLDGAAVRLSGNFDTSLQIVPDTLRELGAKVSTLHAQAAKSG